MSEEEPGLQEYVEWEEPYSELGNPVLMRMSKAHVIEEMHAVAKSHGVRYATDTDALDDFLVMHWARIVVEAPRLSETKKGVHSGVKY